MCGRFQYTGLIFLLNLFLCSLFLDAIINGIVFLISFSNCLLIVYRNTFNLVCCIDFVSCSLAKVAYSNVFFGAL